MWWECPGKTRGQAAALMFRALHDLDRPPADIIRAATANAAELIGWRERVGTIEVGKFADLMDTSEDPLQAITEIERALRYEGRTNRKNELR
jgi:imidazolonepropionase-like amidohydrolase